MTGQLHDTKNVMKLFCITGLWVVWEALFAYVLLLLIIKEAVFTQCLTEKSKDERDIERE